MRQQKLNIFICLLLIVIFGLISIYLEKDINWDLRNYHFYNSYSFLNGRINYDYLPAQIQTFHSIFLHLFIYKLITHVTPKIAGFLIGGIQGINCFLVFLISRRILPKDYSSKLKLFLSFLITTLGAYSPMFISELGTTFGDNLSSILVLIGVIFVISNQKYKYLLSGLFFGFSIGFKLTNLVYGLAAIITVFILQKAFKQKISSTASIIFGLSVGTLVTGGYWMWIMLKNYGNPLFPYYNAIFKSPYFQLVNFRDERFTPKNIVDAISYPLLWVVKEHPSLELPFRDVRWLIICFLFMIIFLKLFIRKPERKNYLFLSTLNTNIKSSQHTIVLFTFFSFFIWLFQFGYHRYLIPLELISGLAIFCLLDRILKRKFIKLNLFILLTVLIVTTTQSPNWGRVPWNHSWFEVTIPNIEVPKQTLVVMVGKEPTSYVIPFFPKQVRFVRIDGNFVKLIKNTLLEKEISQIIQKHQGDFLILFAEHDKKNYTNILKNYNLKTAKKQCQLIKSQFEKLKLCHLDKLY